MATPFINNNILDLDGLEINSPTIDGLDNRATDLDNRVTALESGGGGGGSAESVLKGKTIVCFGDSITEFVGTDGRRYSDWLAILSGANVINVGIGGTQIRQRIVPTLPINNATSAYGGVDIVNLVKAACEQDFTIVEACGEYFTNHPSEDPYEHNAEIIARLKSIDWSKVDIVTLFAGTNDWTGGNHLGTIDSTDTSTTLGAFNKIVEMLLTTYPHIKFYYFSPIVRWMAKSIPERTDANWCDNYGTEGNRLYNYVSSLLECAYYNHIPCYDMYHNMGWTKYNFSQFFLDTDGTHPYKGFRRIAERLKSVIESNF